MMRLVTIQLGDERHDIDLDQALHIHNADAERHTVAADVAWWGAIAAAAVSQTERLAAVCASWHSNALARCLEQDEKIAEWKAKALAQSQPQYLAYQEAIADARGQAEKASAVHWSLIKKYDMLQAMLPGEAGDRRASRDIGHRESGYDPGANPSTKEPRLAKFQQARQHKED